MATMLESNLSPIGSCVKILVLMFALCLYLRRACKLAMHDHLIQGWSAYQRESEQILYMYY